MVDFETGSVDPHTTIPLQLAAKAYNARTLKPWPDGEFNSLMAPKAHEWDKIEDEALRINNIKKGDLEKAPAREHVWNEFVAFVTRFNKERKPVTAPIMAGHNIISFDAIIIDRLSKEFGPTDKEGRSTLFHRRDKLDLMHIAFLWFENSNLVDNYKLDTLRDVFMLSKAGAHDALVDVRQTGELLMQFLSSQRKVKVTFPCQKRKGGE